MGQAFDVPSRREAARVKTLCREAGVIIGVGGQQGNVLRLQPPLIITQEQLARAIHTVAEALAACHQLA